MVLLHHGFKLNMLNCKIKVDFKCYSNRRLGIGWISLFYILFNLRSLSYLITCMLLLELKWYLKAIMKPLTADYLDSVRSKKRLHYNLHNAYHLPHVACPLEPFM